MDLDANHGFENVIANGALRLGLCFQNHGFEKASNFSFIKTKVF
jgi:hypothetical protein